MEQYKNDFDGVFRFTNATKEDFIALWNNKEYSFPAGKTVPLIIPDETLENIQEIRKKFAYKLAVREFYNGTQYAKMAKMGNGLPPTFDEKILEPMIEQCLTPLPMEKLVVKEGKKDDERKYRASKAVPKSGNLNEIFKDAPIEERGAMPNTAI